jgi:peptidoglycan/xylan/chitin deacetylase (PgdA/CDA1 family)
VGDLPKGLLKAVLAAAVHYSGMGAAFRASTRAFAGGRRVLVLGYHRVVEDFVHEARTSIPSLLVSRKTFAAHLDALSRARCDVVPMDEALDVLAGRRRPRREVAVLTFDDGYRDLFDVAFPLLTSKGVPATVYLASGLVGTKGRFLHDRLFRVLQVARARGTRLRVAPQVLPLSTAVARLLLERPGRKVSAWVVRMEQRLGLTEAEGLSGGEVLTWEMAREMCHAGVTFGAHTVNHPVLTTEAPDVIEREIAGSKRESEERLGVAVRDFAYPNGCYDRGVVAALVRHGFRSGVTTEERCNAAGGDVLRLGRTLMWEGDSQGPFGYSDALAACRLSGVSPAARRWLGRGTGSSSFPT